MTLEKTVMWIPRSYEGETGLFGMFQEPQGHVPRAEQGVAWEEIRSPSESLFSGPGFILVDFSLSKMGSPWSLEQKRGGFHRV